MSTALRMKIKSYLAKPFAAIVHGRIKRAMRTALADQDKILSYLIQQARKTDFGKDHHFSEINDYESFRDAVSIRDYEALSPYIQRVKEGKQGVLWPGRPIYFAKTSGTTSGAKYIPKIGRAHV